MNMRQFYILFNSAKTWHVIVCWFLCFPPNLPELNLKLFCSDVQNNFRFSSGKFGGKHRNQQTITSQVLTEFNKISSSLIFIKLYLSLLLFVYLGRKFKFSCNFQPNQTMFEGQFFEICKCQTILMCNQLFETQILGGI